MKAQSKLLVGVLVNVAMLAAGTSIAVAASDGSGDQEDPRTELDAAIETLEPAALKQWPSTFAGLWLNDGGTIHIAFTEDAEKKVDELAQGFIKPDLLRAETVRYSLAELESRQSELVSAREAAQNGEAPIEDIAGGDFDLNIDLQENAVVAILPYPTAEAASALQERADGGLLVEGGELTQPEACDTRFECKPNLRSGLGVLNSSGVPCSSAFVVKKLSTGTKNLLSAAHCTGSSRFNDGEKYGEVQEQQQQGRVDAERHSISENGFDSIPAIYVNEDWKSRDVTSEGTYAELPIGRDACKSGATTDKSCGRVLSKTFSPSYVDNSERFIQTKYCAQGGDSGAGVYDNERALGVHSGGSPGACSDPGDYSLFGHIEYAQNALDVNVDKP